MADPLDHHGDALRQALHAEAATYICDPYALDRIRARTSRLSGYSRGHDVLAVAALLLILLITLGGS